MSEISVKSSLTPAKFDFSKYQTADLVRHLTELASFPGALRTTLLMAVRFAALFVLLVYLLLKSWDASSTAWISGTLYSLFVGLLLGTCLGVLRVVTGALGNIGAILNLVLEIMGKVSSDVEKISVSEMGMPSGGDLMEQVYDNVVDPCLEKAIGNSLGVLGKPLVWCYRRTLGSSVRYVILRVQRTELTEHKSMTIQNEVEQPMTAIVRGKTPISVFAESAAKFIGQIGIRIRFYAMLPLYIAFLVAMAAAFLPLVIMWWLTN